MDDRTEPHHGSYENYSKTSATYDQFRTPIGIGIILDILKEGGIAPERARVLDAGCGTGNYLVALHGQVASLTGLEFNAGMLGRAQEKLARAGHATLHQGSVLAMPFADASFDAVMLNQVIHHLDQGDDASHSDWPHLICALRECHRVLRSGGVLMINTCTQQQVVDGSWYNSLVPAAVARMCRRYVPVGTLYHLLVEAGFRVGEPRIPNELFGGDTYFDPSGPFDPNWRNGDSLWALATETELESGLATLRRLHESGEVEAFIREHDRIRQSIGQSVTVPAWRD